MTSNNSQKLSTTERVIKIATPAVLDIEARAGKGNREESCSRHITEHGLTMSCHEHKTEACAMFADDGFAIWKNVNNNEIEERQHSKNQLRKRRSKSVSPTFRGKNYEKHGYHNDPKELNDQTLYVRARQNLQKINRVSKSSIAIPKTPSKSGVYTESSIGRFAQVKSLFDRQLRGTDDQTTKKFICDKTRNCMRDANSLFRKFTKTIVKSETKHQRLHDSEFRSTNPVTFDVQEETVEVASDV